MVKKTSKKITSDLTPTDALMSVMSSIIDPSVVSDVRKNVFIDTVEKHIVDTVEGFDTHVWETGILPPNGKWIIVEQYDDAEAAKAGHARWVADIKKGQRNFKDIDIFNLGL